MHTRTYIIALLTLTFALCACSGTQKPDDDPIGTPPAENDKRLPRDPSKDDTSQLRPTPTQATPDRTLPG